jgi:hypothetical protein
MRILTTFVASILLITIWANAAEPLRMTLKEDIAGELPKGWLAAKTGEGPGSVWKVVEDKTCIDGKVLAQTSSEGANRLFNLCIAQDTNFKDVDIELAIKAMRGEKDQGGGPVWRYTDAKNYYVARVNPLEDNYRVYKVVDGKRIELGTIDVDVPAGQWHRLRVVHQGDHIQCFLNDKLKLDVHDSTFAKGGNVGLWTKADAATYFADLTARESSGDMEKNQVVTEREYPGLRHVMQPAKGVYSGGEPKGAEGFESLRKMGIKTIVSVDGAMPDVESARKYGLRYVHIPFGYDGIPKNAEASITAMARETDGLIYIHCHHGVHRGPAAAAIACIASDKFDQKQALDYLRLAGTGKDYNGLWRDVQAFTPPPKDAKLPELKETAEIKSLAKIMAGIDRTFDNLKRSCRTIHTKVP